MADYSKEMDPRVIIRVPLSTVLASSLGMVPDIMLRITRSKEEFSVRLRTVKHTVPNAQFQLIHMLTCK